MVQTVTNRHLAVRDRSGLVLHIEAGTREVLASKYTCWIGSMNEEDPGKYTGKIKIRNTLPCIRVSIELPRKSPVTVTELWTALAAQSNEAQAASPPLTERKVHFETVDPHGFYGLLFRLKQTGLLTRCAIGHVNSACRRLSKVCETLPVPEPKIVRRGKRGLECTFLG